MTLKRVGGIDRRGSGFHAFRHSGGNHRFKTTRSCAGNPPVPTHTLTVGGSIRPQFQNMTGNDGANGYKRNGFDGGTRFRFADYHLFDDISWISYYELGVNIPAVTTDNHAKGATDTTRRMYTASRARRGERWTFGQQNSIYYDVVGVNRYLGLHMIGQAPGNVDNGDYDEFYRTRKSLK